MAVRESGVSGFGVNSGAILKLPCELRSDSPEETVRVGEKIAALLENGGVLALRGTLGAGKTCLTKGIARYFNIDDEITSPTYTIVSEYEAMVNGKTLPFFHIDAYRLSGEDDFTAMGGEEYLFDSAASADGNTAITVVEWSERISGAFLPETLIVDIEISGGTGRVFRVSRGKP